MKQCKKCKGKLKSFDVEVEDADLPTVGQECAKCGELYFDEIKSRAVVESLRKKEQEVEEPPVFGIRQKVIKLSKGRVGLYLSKDVARSTVFKPGKEIELKVLDKKRILVSAS